MLAGTYYQYFYATIVFISLFKTGSATLCYSCDTYDDHKACADPFNTSLFEPVECLNDNFACLKELKLDVELNTTFLSRRCVQKHYCEVFTKAFDVCSTCTYDFCNSSLMLKASLVTMSAVLLFINIFTI